MSLRTLIALLLLPFALALYPFHCDADQTGTAAYSETSDQADRLIRSGVALHDQGKYGEAVAAYEEALTHDPGNLTAIYEIAFSYLAAKEYEKAHASARRGMASRSPLVAELYALSATALDNMGKPQAAIAEFVQALKLFPDNHSLNLNLAISYIREQEIDNARAAAEKTVLVKPGHPSAHLILGQIYGQQRQTLPALMAFGRFLSLEPNSRRTRQAVNNVKSLLVPAMTKGEDGAPVVVLNVEESLSMDRADSGYLSAATHLKLLSASTFVTQKKNNDDSFSTSPVFAGMQALGKLLSDDKKYPDSFATRHYLPFYQELNKRNYNEAFARVTLSALDPNGAGEWFQKNNQLVNEFIAWTKAYTGRVSE